MWRRVNVASAYVMGYQIKLRGELLAISLEQRGPYFRERKPEPIDAKVIERFLMGEPTKTHTPNPRADFQNTVRLCLLHPGHPDSPKFTSLGGPYTDDPESDA